MQQALALMEEITMEREGMEDIILLLVLSLARQTKGIPIKSLLSARSLSNTLVRVCSFSGFWSDGDPTLLYPNLLYSMRLRTLNTRHHPQLMRLGGCMYKLYLAFSSQIITRFIGIYRMS